MNEVNAMIYAAEREPKRDWRVYRDYVRWLDYMGLTSEEHERAAQKIAEALRV